MTTATTPNAAPTERRAPDGSRTGRPRRPFRRKTIAKTSARLVGAATLAAAVPAGAADLHMQITLPEVPVASCYRPYPAAWIEDAAIPLPRPGGDGWLSIARDTGQVLHRQTDRGWIAYLNNLHKGRDAGPIWSLFLDLLAGACIVFSLTGLGLLWLHGRDRPPPGR